MKKISILVIIIGILVTLFGVGGYYLFVSDNNDKEIEMKKFQDEINERIQKTNMLIMNKSQSDKYDEFIDISKDIIKNKKIDKRELLIKELDNFYNKISEENKKELNKKLKELKEKSLKDISEKNKKQIKELIKEIDTNIESANYIEASKLIKNVESEIKYAKENKNNENVKSCLSKAEEYLNKSNIKSAELELGKLDYNKLNYENKNRYNDVKEDLDYVKELLGISGNYKFVEVSSKGAEKYKIELNIESNKEGELSIKGTEKYVSEIKSEDEEIILIDDLEKEMLENGLAVVKQFDVTGNFKMKDSGKKKDINLFEGYIQKTGEEKKKTILKYNGSNIEINYYGRKLVLSR